MTASVTPERKAEILALAERHGAAEAARRTEVSADVIRKWRHRMSSEAAAVVEAVRPGAIATTSGMGWVQRRGTVLDGLARAAATAIGKVEDALATGDGKAAKDLAITLGILIDKAQLLSGQATARTESHAEVRTLSLSITRTPAEIADEVARVRAELGMASPLGELTNGGDAGGID